MASLDVDEIRQSGRLGLGKNLGPPRHNFINIKTEKGRNNPPMTRIFFLKKGYIKYFWMSIYVIIYKNRLRFKKKKYSTLKINIAYCSGAEVMGDLTPNYAIFVLLWPFFDHYLLSADSSWVPWIHACTQVCSPENDTLKIGMLAGSRHCRNPKNLKIRCFLCVFVISRAPNQVP